MALTLTAVEAYRLAAPEAPLFGGPAPATLAESIVEGFGVEQTYQFIGQGQDPNAPIPVDDAEYTGGGTVQVSPLMLAVAANDGSAVRMLLSFGARLDLPQNSRAECLAGESRNPEIRTIIAEHRGSASPPDCSDRDPNAPTPLMAWIGRSDPANATHGR
jgi:hypothetical protein